MDHTYRGPTGGALGRRLKRARVAAQRVANHAYGCGLCREPVATRQEAAPGCALGARLVREWAAYVVALNMRNPPRFIPAAARVVRERVDAGA